MNISLKKTIVQIDRCLAEGGGASADQLHKMYDLTLRLQSQLLMIWRPLVGVLSELQMRTAVGKIKILW